MPRGAHWAYWEENLELMAPGPPGTGEVTGSKLGDGVIRHRATGLLGRIESVAVRTHETAAGTETYRVFSVALEPGQHAVWWDSEIDV
jgi:hypothetical protein